jgi:hypothetical protein
LKSDSRSTRRHGKRFFRPKHFSDLPFRPFFRIREESLATDDRDAVDPERSKAE